VCLEV